MKFWRRLIKILIIFEIPSILISSAFAIMDYFIGAYILLLISFGFLALATNILIHILEEALKKKGIIKTTLKELLE